jgi:hypothetical protein
LLLITSRDGLISIPNTRYYRYQGFEEKYRYWQEYRCFDISAPAIFFHFGQRHHHENTIKVVHFLWCYNGARAGWEFLVMLVATTDIYYSMFILLALLPLLMIKNSLFVVMVVRVGKISISIKNGKYRGNIVSNEKAGIAHP